MLQPSDDIPGRSASLQASGAADVIRSVRVKPDQQAFGLNPDRVEE